MAISSLNLPRLQSPGPERISAHDLAQQLGAMGAPLHREGEGCQSVLSLRSQSR